MLTVSLEDIMSEHPIKVKESVDVGNVCHLLLRYRIGGILIVKDDDPDKLVGIFTTTDALRLLDEALSSSAHKIENLDKVSKQLVGTVATKDVISLQKDTKVVKAIAIMHKKNVHTIPIFDGDKLIGVVGRHDLINVAMAR